MKKKIIKLDIIVFAVVTLISTIDAARIDTGSWTMPTADTGHYMTAIEAFFFDLPLGMTEGVIAVLVVTGAVFAFKLIKTYKETKNDN